LISLIALIPLIVTVLTLVIVVIIVVIIIVIIIVVLVLVFATLFDFLGKCPKFSEQLFKYLLYFIAIAFVFWFVMFAKAFSEFLATVI